MEPLAALGLAGNIVQFVSFASECISTGRDIYQSAAGATKENTELEELTAQLRDLSVNLQVPDKSIPTSLRSVAGQSRDLAEELLDKLDSSKLHATADTKKRKRDAAVQVFKNFWKRKDIDNFSNRLQKLRLQLILEYLDFIQEQVSSIETRLRRDGPYIPKTEITTVVVNSQFQQVFQSLETELAKGVKFQKLFELLESQLAKGKDVEEVFKALEPQLCEVRKLDINLEGVGNGLEYLIKQAEPLELAVRVLNSLTFPAIYRRRTTIEDAHQKTYTWVVARDSLTLTDPPNQKAGQDNSAFYRWLKAEKTTDSAFYITGKPGSGKSTLMKFLSSHPDVYKLLQEWAGPSTRLIITDFYFWKPGTAQQKSQEGLLKTILYQIYKACPDLAESTLPDKMKFNKLLSQEDWALPDLVYIIKTLGARMQDSVRFCFFIDGLDEYTTSKPGGYRDLVALIRNLAEAPNIKICVASRPYNVFIDSFGQTSKNMLEIHAYTSDDMKTFVRDHFESHPRFRQVMAHDPSYKQLESEIVDRAQGVFLWVALVVRTLLEGLDNDDDISILQARLEEIPTELEVLFQSMLESTEKVYRDDAVRIYRILLNIEGASAPALVINLLFDANLKPQIESDLAKTYVADQNLIFKRAETRVRARCRDLLHVISSTSESPAKHNIEFVHRTVYDFMHEFDYEAMLLQGRELYFDPLLFVCFAYADLACVKWRKPRDEFEYSARVMASYRRLKRSRTLTPYERDLNDIMGSVSSAFPATGAITLIDDFGQFLQKDDVTAFKVLILKLNRIWMEQECYKDSQLKADEDLIKGVFVQKTPSFAKSNSQVSFSANVNLSRTTSSLTLALQDEDEPDSEQEL